MKKSLAAFGVGVSVLVALSACQSTEMYSTDSEYTVASGEIPPWLLDGEDSEQILAGPTTQNRNDMIFPDESEAMADLDSHSTSSQVQPDNIAQHTPPPTDEVPFNEAPQITNPPHVDPLAGNSTAVAVNTPTTPPTVTKPKPAQTTKPNKPNKPNKANKPAQKFTEPTLITYTVRKGDNLHDIAKRSRTTIAQIKKDSKLTKDTIYPGQVIKVRYIPKDYKPGKNGSASGKERVHVVAKGETISGIAKKYGVPYTQVLKANNMTLSEAAKIRPGKRLTIPATKNTKNTKR